MRTVHPFMHATHAYVKANGTATVSMQESHTNFNMGFFKVRFRNEAASSRPNTITVSGVGPEVCLELDNTEKHLVKVVYIAGNEKAGGSMSDTEFLKLLTDEHARNFWRELLNATYGLPAEASA